MIQDVIEKLERKLNQEHKPNTAQQQELLNLLDQLKKEIAELSEEDSDQAESIASFTRSSVHEATRPEPRQQLYDLSLEGLKASIDEFEASHPRLARNVNAICVTLSNLGL